MTPGTPALLVAAALFVAFFADVSAGAFARSSFLGDLGEMLTLFAASVAFVVGVLGREKATDRQDRG